MAEPDSQELLKQLREQFTEMLNAERKRLTSERDFLVKVQDQAGFGARRGQFTTDPFSDLFLVEELGKFRLS